MSWRWGDDADSSGVRNVLCACESPREGNKTSERWHADVGCSVLTGSDALKVALFEREFQRNHLYSKRLFGLLGRR